jgi:hypothetical protein
MVIQSFGAAERAPTREDADLEKTAINRVTR